MKRKFFIGLLSISLGLYCAQSFVVQKQEKPKKESRSHLKERVCQGLYDMLHKFADMLSSLSSAQRSLLQAVSDFIANEKKNAIDGATEQELKALVTELDEVTQVAKNLEMKLVLLEARLSKK